jgi:hypothetical protein
MYMHKLAMSLTVGLMLTVAASGAEARQIHLRGTFSDTFSPLDSDVNNDGEKAALATGTSRNIGGRRSTFQSRNEFLPALPAPVTCPNDTLELPLLISNTVSTDVLSGDQLFGYSTAGTSCLNPLTGAFTFQGTEIYWGGTGSLTGATGSAQVNSSGFLHICDPAGGCFGNETGTYTGTLTVP